MANGIKTTALSFLPVKAKIAMQYGNLFGNAYLASWVLAACCKKSVGSGGTNNSTNCSTVSASFATHVLPLLHGRYTTSLGCHAGSTNSGSPLTNHVQISTRANQIRSSVNVSTKPKGSWLTNADKATISGWVDAGALNK
jgi:hypothetical protein